jgi:NTE family protein
MQHDLRTLGTKMRLADFDVALVLSGGAALGAYQAGAYEALHEAGLLPSHVAGTSIGAFNGTLIAGNRPEDRVARLAQFWDAVAEPIGRGGYAFEHGPVRRVQARMASARARLLGRQHFHAPQLFEALAPVRAFRSPGLYDLRPAAETLCGLADLPGPGSAGPRLTLHATELATGDSARFDSRVLQLRPEHVLASASLLPDYPPTEVDGRLLCDGGFSENLPLRAMLSRVPERALLCVAVDLIPSVGEPRWSLDGMAERQMDLQFSSQTRRLIEAVEAELALAAERSRKPLPPVVLAHLVHQGREDAGSQKVYDFSRQTIASRRLKGLEEARVMLTDLAARPAVPGLTVWRFPDAAAEPQVLPAAA